MAELVGAGVSGSLALLADAGHVFTDAVGLGIALLASHLTTRPATLRHTWGLQRAEVLAATLQAAVLLGVGVFVAVEAVRRLLDPPPVAALGMGLFGALGLVGNLVGVAVLTRSRTSSLNTRAAFLEVVNDALGSVAVVVAAVVIGLTGWLPADALVSLLIAALIVPRTVRLLREAVDVLLEGAPRGLDLAAVREHLLGVDRVIAVHDLHASQIATGLPVLTAHVVVEESCFVAGHAPRVLDELQACLVGHFPVSVEHSTFQLEPAGHSEHEERVHD